MTATVDDPATAQNPDFVVGLGSSDQYGNFNSANEHIAVLARAGDTVTVDDGNGLTSSYVITALTITEVKAATDTVSGTAAPGSRVAVLAGFHWPKDAADATEMANRYVVADSSGNWTVNFAVLAGPEGNGLSDIRIGSGVAAQQINPDPPIGWPWVDFPVTFWSLVDQNWIIQQLQPQATQDCKLGRWAYVVDKAQNHFVNQGDCVSYVASGGNNPAHGDYFS